MTSCCVIRNLGKSVNQTRSLKNSDLVRAVLVDPTPWIGSFWNTIWTNERGREMENAVRFFRVRVFHSLIDRVSRDVCLGRYFS
jgi:hypothetical protein